MNVSELMLARGEPDTVALIDHGGAATTYRELRREVERVAAHLQALGVEPGARVLLVAENTLFFVAAYLGTMRAGNVVVPVAPHVTPQELSFVVESATPAVAFVQRKAWDRLADTLASVKHTVIDVAPDKVTRGASSFQALASLAPGVALEERVHDGNELAALMFTSGSTGTPRGVMISHANIEANTRSIAEYLGLSASDRIMAVLPMHYCYGASLLHTHLFVGGSVVIDNRFMFADKVLKRMNDLGCTGFAGVPSHFRSCSARRA